MQPLTALRKVPSPARFLGAAVLVATLALTSACGGSTAGASTSAANGSAATPQVAPDGGQGAAAPVANVDNTTGCNATKATYVADTSGGATVKGGMGGNLNPTVDDILATFAAQQPPIGSSSSIASILPRQGSAGAICANGDIYQGANKVATGAMFATRIPGGPPVQVNDQKFYVTSAEQALTNVGTTICPALVEVLQANGVTVYVRAICLNNDDVVYSFTAVV